MPGTATQIETRRLGVQTRLLPVRREAIDADARTVELAFSSETPVDRFFGLEILDHGRDAVRLDRIREHGPLLLDHNSRDVVGVVEEITIGADRVGRAVVRFGGGQRATEVFQDVVDGIRKSVSVGYQIHAMQLEQSGDAGDTYRITDWEPVEISLVSIPADLAVGVGREQEENGILTTITRNHSLIMDPVTISPPASPSPEEVRAQLSTARESGAATERNRVKTISALAKTHKRTDLGEAAIGEGVSVDVFQSRLLEVIGTPVSAPVLGMEKPEIRRYSLFRAIRALANPTNQAAQREAAFEFECSDAQRKLNGREGEGICIPHDVLVGRVLTQAGRRDLTVGAPTAGGNLVGTDILGGSFIDVLRASNPIMADAMILSGLTGDVAIPRHSAATIAYWVAESGSPTEGAPTFDQVTLSPKTVGAYLDLSRKLVQQSSIDMEAFAFMDLSAQLGLALGDVAIEGGGTNQPVGILGTAGIGNVAGGTNGLAPAWAHIANIKKEVAKDNALMGVPKWYLNADTVGKLETVERSSGSGYFILDSDRGGRTMGGYGYVESNLVPNDLAKGTGTGLSAIIFGNFADVLIGLWGGLDFIVDTATGSTSGTLRVVALQSADVGIRHPQSFSAMKDAITV